MCWTPPCASPTATIYVIRRTVITHQLSDDSLFSVLCRIGGAAIATALSDKIAVIANLA